MCRGGDGASNSVMSAWASIMRNVAGAPVGPKASLLRALAVSLPVPLSAAVDCRWVMWRLGSRVAECDVVR